MSGLSLAVGGRYKTADGVIVKIVSSLSPDGPRNKSLRGFAYTDADYYDQGYRFKADNDDTYLPNGRYDIDEEDSCLDLVEVVLSDYILIWDWGETTIGEQLMRVSAPDPLSAIRVFQKSFDGNVNKVYELSDVTPEEANAENTQDDKD